MVVSRLGWRTFVAAQTACAVVLGLGPAVAQEGAAGGSRPAQPQKPLGGASAAVSRSPVARPLPEADALAAGLAWLIRHQGPHGGWHASAFCPSGRCDGPGRDDYDLALTGMALQALAAWEGASAPDGRGQKAAPTYEAAIARGASWLAESLPTQLEGAGTWHFYNLAIGAAGLAAVLERQGPAAGREALRAVVGKILESQNADGGWGSPTAVGRASDSSGTGWCLDALAAARRAKIEVPDAAFERARGWYESVTGSDGRVGYQLRGDGGFAFRSLEERYASHEIMSATRFAVLPPGGDASERRRADRALKLLAGDPPSAAAESADYLYWYQGTRALLGGAAGSGLTGRLWLRSFRRAVLRKQDRGGGTCVDGAWAPDDRWSAHGGRVYATALNALTLERALPALRDLAGREAERASGAARERIQGLVRQLGSAAPAERDAATQALLEAGDAGESLLREALKADDAEVRARARMILDRLGLEERE